MFEIRSEGEYREDGNKCECCDLDVVGELWATSDVGESDLNIIELSAVWIISEKLSWEELWWFKSGHLVAVLCAGHCKVEVSDGAIASDPVSIADRVTV